MTTLLPTLAERDDCVPILSEILRHGRACPGITLVGMLDLDTGAVLSVRRLASMGAACDCQLVEAYGLWEPFAVFEEAAYVAAVAAGDPEPVELGCCGVRKGSTQPCAKWGHRRLKRG